MSEGVYFQFPLCSLAFGENAHTRFNHVICYCGIELGKSLSSEESPPPCSISTYDLRDKNHAALWSGSQKLGFTSKNAPTAVSQWKALRSHVRHFEFNYGADAWVRVPTDLVFEVRDNRGISLREFSLFAALVSVIGAKTYPVRVTRDCLRIRMLGYRSAAMMEAELANRRDGAEPLSLRQINYTLDALHERLFFARARANERQTFYSIRLTQAELEAAILRSKTYRPGFHAERKTKDAALMQRVKEARETLLK